MIDARELRIGNYVEYAGGGLRTGYVAVDGDMIGGIEMSDEEHYNPIPLTDEILTEWCGFKANEYGFPCANYMKSETGYTLDGFNISFRDGMFFVWNEVEDQWCSDELFRIEYIHELQNAYYTFKKEELQIKIK